MWKAKAKLRDMHEVVLFNRLEQLRKKQRDEALRYAEEVKSALVGPSTSVNAGNDEDEMEVEDEDEPEQVEEAAPVKAEPWNPEWEPPLMKRIPEEFRTCQVLDFNEDRAKLYAARRAVAQARFVVKPRGPAQGEGGAGTSKDDAIYQAAVGQGFDAEEELFNLEAEMSRPSYSWEDKYRPRKPRYFNKVHTGYEWNKYNQTHYEYVIALPLQLSLRVGLTPLGAAVQLGQPSAQDRPGLQVQHLLPGPHRQDQGSACVLCPAPEPRSSDADPPPCPPRNAEYRIIKNKENPDICTIIFSAGPPYEDIAFTIVNKQWEHSHKRGFRSSFDRGVLQLHFSFRCASRSPFFVRAFWYPC